VTVIAPAIRPDAFARASGDLAGFLWCAGITVDALPAPRGIAPFTAAIEADIADERGNESSGRFILLHDPAGNPAWGGDFRCVTAAQAPIDEETVFDQWRAAVGWSWLIDALTDHEAGFAAPSGTVTVTASTPFGGLRDQPSTAGIELRASWTPELADGDGLAQHLAAWQDLLLLMAGLPPLAANIVPLTRGSRS